MSRKRHKPEEIVSKLRQVDVLVAQGTPVADAVRSIGVTEVQTAARPGQGHHIARSSQPWTTSETPSNATIPPALGPPSPPMSIS